MARSTCPSRREDSFVIHWDWPVKVAILPSSDIALLIVTKGLPVCIYVKKCSFSSAHSSLHTGQTTSMPASRSKSMPFPDTSGLGSVLPTTTLAMPASIIRSAQGGVLP